MYDDMHDNTTTHGHADGLDLFKSHRLGSVIHDNNILPDVSHDSFVMGGTMPLEAGVHDNWQMEFPEGNGEELMAYPDPLAHAGEFHPAPFEFNDSQVGMGYGDVNSTDEVGYSSVSYAMAVDGGIMPSCNDVDELPGIENGMLSDPSQLDGLIAVGEVQGTAHISAEDVVRSEEAKMTFLHEHGYSEVPAGYEVHHIVPLSQGGADDPHNMVLLTEAQHDLVTTAHRQYYGW